jgi:predicted MFS family arabinose efflux permease
VVEGVPSLVLGVVVFFVLPDVPQQARWLAPEECAWLCERLERERSEPSAGSHLTLKAALGDRRVLVLSAIYFLNVVGGYGLDFFTPTLAARAFPDLGPERLGLLLSIPPLITLPLMLFYGRRADATRDYAGHVALAAFAFALGLILLALPLGPSFMIVAMTVCVAARWSLVGPFWSLPSALLTGTAAAGGIAWINAIGNLGGQAGPVILERFTGADGSFSVGLYVLALLLGVCGGLALYVRRAVESPAVVTGRET